MIIQQIQKTGLYFGDYLLKCEVQSAMVMKSCIFDSTEMPVANQGSAAPSLLLSQAFVKAPKEPVLLRILEISFNRGSWSIN